MPDLWPEDFGKLDLTPPVAILREQAELLGKRTGGAVIGHVATGREGNKFEHSFYVVAPSLENYTYCLFVVTHPIQFYPLKVWVDAKDNSADNQEDFLEILKSILTSEKTQQVVKAIWSQVETDPTVAQSK